jgi:hypothetical protein
MNLAALRPGRPVVWGLIATFALVAMLRIAALHVGSPYITIDDKTAYEGGFLVWFGHAPPQRMYLESWLYGVVCIAVYAWKVISGAVTGGLDVDLVARAYRDFYNHPGAYVSTYRAFTLLVDLITGYWVYRIATLVLGDRWRGWAAAAVPAMYLLSYNTLWSGVVARPDSITAFFATLGVLLYLKSDVGRNQSYLLGSAAVLGAAAGMKLHGACFTILLCFDLLRVHGLAAGLRKAVVFAPVAGFFFCVTAGSPLFDPLTYLKLRVENYTADRSPWITWGGHFLTVLEGAGWIGLPLAALGAWWVRRVEASRSLRSIMVVAVGWVLLFLLMRALRAYWMLPALPLFYVLAIYAATEIRQKYLGPLAVGLLVAALMTQYALQLNELRTARYSELSDWVVANARGRAFYILGDDALILPRNSVCLGRMGRLLQQSVQRDLDAGMPFTLRHVKNWEETSSLALLDMLSFTNEPGYEFYDYYSAPPDLLTQVAPFDAMQFIVVQDRFDPGLVPGLREKLAADYRPVAEKHGAGGGPQGLKYVIFERR